MLYTIVKEAAQTNALSPSSMLVTSLRGVAASAIASQTYANAVIVQPDVRFDVLPDFPEQQARMRQHAQTFKTNVLPAVIQVSTDTVDFYNTYASYYEVLYPIARQLAAGDISQQGKFVTGLQDLASLATEKESRAGSTASALTRYARDVAQDGKAINAAKATFDAKVIGGQGELKQAQDSLNSLESRLNSDTAQIAAGAAGAGFGVALVVLGIFTEIPSAGSSTSVILAGLGMTVTASGVIARAAADFDAGMKDYVQEMQKIARLQHEISIFSAVTQQLSRLDVTAQSGENAAGDLDEQWGSVKTNYGKLIDDFTQQNLNALLPLRLSTALEQWRAIADNARAFQTNLTMAVETRQLSL